MITWCDMDIHFSVDDVFGAFLWLEKTNAESIYDSFVFSALKALHERYGISIDAYCIYKIGDRSLADVSDKWKDEFLQNEDWLRFGFHALTDDSNYTEMSPEEIERHYRIMEYDIKRITGCENLSEIIRLHYFSGNKATSQKLRALGIRALLTADDDRISYGLAEDEVSQLSEKGVYYDPEIDMTYYRTAFRIEKMDGDYCKSMYERFEKLCFFTHEPLLNDHNIIARINEVLDKTVGE